MISNIELYDAPADDEDGRMGEDEATLALNQMFGIKEPRFITFEVVRSQIYATLNGRNAGYDLKQIVPIVKQDSVRYLIVMERK